MPARVQPLIDPAAPVTDPAAADCAVFYSITNCQEGLRGVSFGNFLIKQVVEELGRDFPGLSTFTTLSPVPGFGEWIKSGNHPLTSRTSRPAFESCSTGCAAIGRTDRSWVRASSVS